MRITTDDLYTSIKALCTTLEQKQMHLATAESCTGGELGALITELPGVSKVYVGGVVTYADALKVKFLGVDAGMIKKHGAVSEPVAKAMAQGALKATGATVAVSLTGVAGPDGGTIDKPVGTVWCGLARGDGKVAAHLLQLSGDRAAIRYAAAKQAIKLVHDFVSGEK